MTPYLFMYGTHVLALTDVCTYSPIGTVNDIAIGCED